jgi:DNA-binding transcriptional regulator YdaS (Cro superfamily)
LRYSPLNFKAERKELLMDDKTPLERAIQAAGSMQALATHLGVTKGAVFQWKLPGRKVPAEYCPTIERITSIRCEDLRPDVDWAYLRSASQEVA